MNNRHYGLVEYLVIFLAVLFILIVVALMNGCAAPQYVVKSYGTQAEDGTVYGLAMKDNVTWIAVDGVKIIAVPNWCEASED